VERLRVAGLAEQDILGADYALLNTTTFNPSPDWWLLVLWQRLVGTAVLDATLLPASASAPLAVRTYAFCAQASGRAALVLVNLLPSIACVSLPADAVRGEPFSQWSLTGGDGGGAASVVSAETLLNGELLALDDTGKVPPLEGLTLAGSVLHLPPVSVNLVSYATSIAACAY
jgi:heparanase 1